MKVKRIFHPVGQGAFYRETIDQFNFIYDCGAKKYGINSSLKRETQKFFDKEKKIDLLTISHFDADHYNGVKFLLENNCLIKKIMIPYLSEEVRVLNLLERITRKDENDKDDKKLKNDLKIIAYPIKELKERFEKSDFEIIEVLPIKSENIEKFSEDEEIEYDKISDKIYSGVNITVEKRNEWVIRPFNLDIDYIDINKLLKINEILKLDLSSQCLNITNILKKLSEKIEDDTLLKEIKIETVDQELKSVYNELGLEKNKYSLCCYSGLKNDRASVKIGCLYTGDYNAKDEIDSLLKFYDKYKKNVGIVQIPHHGSYENYTDKLILKNVKTALISASKENQYNHPSADVVKDIAYHCLVCIVNEDEKSCYKKNYRRFK